MLKNLFCIFLVLSLGCHETKRVEIRLRSPDGRFEFKELTFALTEIYKTYNLEKDWEKIIRDKTFYPQTKVNLTKKWFGSYYLKIDPDTDYLIGVSANSGGSPHITDSGIYPIYRNRQNHIDLFMNFNPELKVKYSKTGHPNALEFSWSTFSEAKYYSLSVRPILRDNPNPEESLSCFTKNRNSVTLAECFRHKSSKPIGFPDVAQDVFSLGTADSLRPGTYEFSIIAFTYDDQLSQYVSMSNYTNEVSKTEVIINPY